MRIQQGVLHRAFVVVATLAALGGCAAKTAPPPAPESEGPIFTDEYRIGVGDNLSINVWRNPDLSVDVPVRPDGKISVPLAGDVMVGGKTPMEVSDTITQSLAKFIRDPYVTVIVTGMGSGEYLSRVRITGAVGSQQSMPYREGMTVLDVVLEAGGPNEFANPSKTVLYRSDGTRLDIELNRLLNKGDMSTNYPLQPGDVITVPERAF